MDQRCLIVKSSSIEIHDYTLGDLPELERALSYYDRISFKVVPFGLYYDEETRILHLPRGLDISYLERITGCQAVFSYDGYRNKKPTKIRLKAPPINDLQKKSIAFLTAKGEFISLQNRSQYILSLTTGAGKTYCTVAAIALLDTIPMIMTPTDNIKQQWIDAFEAYTDVTPSDILDIKNSSIIKRLMKKGERLTYRAYIVNRQTLSSYAKKHGWRAVGELFVRLGIGVKIFDEAHLTLQSNFMIDYFTDVYITYYLTATFNRSDPNENRIMQLAFKNVAGFGNISREVLKKHMIYTKVFFQSNPTLSEKMKIMKKRGFSQLEYSNYITKKDRFVDVLYQLMDSIIKMNPDESLRVMITSSTIASTEEIKEIIKMKYPELSVGTYHSEMDPEEKEYNKDHCNVICTTPMSLGTGSNIPGLRFLINIVPYKSKVTADQLSGRLRYIDDKGTIFFELIDKDFSTIIRWFKSREKTICDKAKKNVEITL